MLLSFLHNLQISISHHQPLTTCIFKIDFDTRMRAIAFEINDYTFTKLAVRYPLSYMNTVDAVGFF